MIYNKERKETYFDLLRKENPQIVYNIQYLFKHTAPIEESWGKDLCDFTVPEILKLASTFNAASTSALSKNFSIFRRYATWCCNNKLSIDNINHFQEVSKDDFIPYVNQSKNAVYSKEELYEIIETFMNAQDQFIILALFEKCYENDRQGDLLRISLSDINKETGILTLPTGKTRIVSSKLYEIAEKSSQEEYYYTYQKNGDLFPVKLDSTNHIVKLKSNAKLDTEANRNKSIMRKLVLIRKNYEQPNLKIPTLKFSGIICELKKIMEQCKINKDILLESEETFRKYAAMANPNYSLLEQDYWTIRYKIKELL